MSEPSLSPRLVGGCRMIDFPVIEDARGNLSVIEGLRHLPFDIKRVYHLFDVPAGAGRAGHAHRALHEVIVAISGGFDVTLDDGSDRTVIHLSGSTIGLYLPPMIWRDLDRFTPGAVCLALASEWFDEADYIRDYADFRAAAASRR